MGVWGKKTEENLGRMGAKLGGGKELLTGRGEEGRETYSHPGERGGGS